MRSKFALILLIAFFSVPALAQDAINVANHNSIGFPQNGVFNGSDFDTVQLNNGNLHIEIPLWSLPGRGLGAYLKLIYDSKSWYLKESCHTSRITGETDCGQSVWESSGGHASLKFVTPIGFVARRANFKLCGDLGFYYSNFTLREDDGTTHHFVPDKQAPAYVNFNGTAYVCTWNPATLYADDGSGWMATLNSSGAIDHYYRKDGAMLVGGNLLEDSNGNYLTGFVVPSTGQVTSYADTMGRTVEGTPASSYTDGSGQLHYISHYYDSNGAQQSIDVTYVNVAIQTSSCPFANDPCTENTTPLSVPSTIKLPNGQTYVFQYQQNSYGQPTSVTLPTGGQLQWAWGAAGDESGPVLASRTETVNGVSSTWTYSFQKAITGSPGYGIVTDPLGNAMKSTFTCFVPGFTNWYASGNAP